MAQTPLASETADMSQQPSLSEQQITTVIREHLDVFSKVANEASGGPAAFASTFSLNLINHPKLVASIIREACGYSQESAEAFGFVGIPLAVSALIRTVQHIDHHRLIGLLQRELGQFVEVAL